MHLVDFLDECEGQLMGILHYIILSVLYFLFLK